MDNLLLSTLHSNSISIFPNFQRSPLFFRVKWTTCYFLHYIPIQYQNDPELECNVESKKLSILPL